MNTYGATRFILVSNGYSPTSATSPGSHGHRVADDLGAVLTIPQGHDCGLADCERRRVLALTVIVRDKAIRADVAAAIAKHVGKGPVRIASDGSETHVVRWDNKYEAPVSQSSAVATGETWPAVALDATDRPDPMRPPMSSIIRLDGTWKHGDLLTVPRVKLPALQNIGALFADIQRALDAHAAPFEFDLHGYKNRKPTGTAHERVPMVGSLSALKPGEAAQFDHGLNESARHVARSPFGGGQ